MKKRLCEDGSRSLSFKGHFQRERLYFQRFAIGSFLLRAGFAPFGGLATTIGLLFSLTSFAGDKNNSLLTSIDLGAGNYFFASGTTGLSLSDQVRFLGSVSYTQASSTSKTTEFQAGAEKILREWLVATVKGTARVGDLGGFGGVFGTEFLLETMTSLLVEGSFFRFNRGPLNQFALSLGLEQEILKRWNVMAAFTQYKYYSQAIRPADAFKRVRDHGVVVDGFVNWALQLATRIEYLRGFYFEVWGALMNLTNSTNEAIVGTELTFTLSPEWQLSGHLSSNKIAGISIGYLF